MHGLKYVIFSSNVADCSYKVTVKLFLQTFALDPKLLAAARAMHR